MSADLSSSAEGGGVKQGEVLEGYFAGKDDKGVYADEMAELFCEEGVKNKGALRGTEGRLLRMGPESGIVDGESPSISLPYIDGTGHKRTNTCAYMVSTESVCHQLGSCLMARYLFPTEGQLGEVAHGEDAAEDELPVGVRRGEAGPDGADGFAFADWGASRDCGVGELRRLCREEGRTCCSLMLMPSSAIRMADAKLAGGGGAGVAAGFACG